MKEAINHPEHYNKGIEAIDIIESWDLNFSHQKSCRNVNTLFY